METDLDQLYLEWLYSQVASVKTRVRSRTFWSLLNQLHEKHFTHIAVRDDNRATDGKGLRDEFVSECDIHDVNDAWLDVECTMLELLIGLSRRLEFAGDAPAAQWFWHLMEVLDLNQFNDKEYDHHAHLLIDEALDRVIWRRYSPDGSGGLFPLRNPQEDQREVELWYQFNAYLLEQLA